MTAFIRPPAVPGDPGDVRDDVLKLATVLVLVLAAVGAWYLTGPVLASLWRRIGQEGTLLPLAACVAIAALPWVEAGRTSAVDEPWEDRGVPGRSIDEILAFRRALVASSEDRAAGLERFLADRSGLDLDWPVADALVLGLRAFGLTGSTRHLRRVGRAMSGDGTFSVPELAAAAAEVRREIPFADLPIARGTSATAFVMREHAAAVERAGRPVPSASVRWLKRHSRPAWYAFLNGRVPPGGPYHPEGLPGVVELYSEGRSERVAEIARRCAAAIHAAEQA